MGLGSSFKDAKNRCNSTEDFLIANNAVMIKVGSDRTIKV